MYPILMKKTTKEYLEEAKTIAIIGISDRAYRTSNHIADFLQQQGYKIIAINPNLNGEVLGEPVYRSIKDVGTDVQIDIVNIFRNKRYTEQMVDEVIEWSKGSHQKPLIWTQLDVSSQSAEQKALEADFPYIKNQCIMVEHGRHGVGIG